MNNKEELWDFIIVNINHDKEVEGAIRKFVKLKQDEVKCNHPKKG